MANKVILIGHVGKNPDHKEFNGGSEVASFSLATTEKWTSGDGEKKSETSWHNVVFWGKLAGLCKKFVFKGSKIYVEGKIKYETYEKDGEKKYITKIIGEKLEFLSRKGETDDSGSGESGPSNDGDDFDENSDIPF
jgi:single-strand DNA-binding protein